MTQIVTDQADVAGLTASYTDERSLRPGQLAAVQQDTLALGQPDGRHLRDGLGAQLGEIRVDHVVQDQGRALLARLLVESQVEPVDGQVPDVPDEQPVRRKPCPSMVPCPAMPMFRSRSA